MFWTKHDNLKRKFFKISERRKCHVFLGKRIIYNLPKNSLQFYMIELNRKYSGKELAKELFDISDGTFRNSKQEYLDYMSEFYE